MKKLFFVILLLFAPFLYSQESIGYDKFKLGMDVSEVSSVIQSDYTDWELSTKRFENSSTWFYELAKDGLPKISLYFLINKNDKGLSQISLVQHFDSAKSVKSEYNRLISILNKKYGKAKYVNKGKTFVITEWATNDYQHIRLRYVSWADEDQYYYQLSYNNQPSNNINKSNSKPKNDDSDKF